VFTRKGKIEFHHFMLSIIFTLMNLKRSKLSDKNLRGKQGKDYKEKEKKECRLFRS